MRERYKEGSSRSAKNILSVVEKTRENNEVILVFLHRSVDGDCVGSSSGIVSIIRALGGDAYVAIPEDLPENMSFLKIDELFFHPNSDSELAREFRAQGTIGGKKVGAAIAERALKKGIEEVVFDRGGYIYHGRVQALAESARENGLKF